MVAEANADCCLMHMLGEPRTMQDDPRYDDVVAEVKAFLEERMGFAIDAAASTRSGSCSTRGSGSARRSSTTSSCCAGWASSSRSGDPVVIGTSRKSFLGRITGREVDDRVAATIATNVLAYERGARVFRVHDVAPVNDALTVAAATVTRAMDDPDEYDEVDEDEGEEHPEPEVTIEISGLSLFTHVGVTAAEREVGQRLLLDLRLDVGECDATVTDRIEDTVDYAQVCDIANLVAQQR